MPARDDLQSIDLTDFRPGISTRTHSLTVSPLTSPDTPSPGDRAYQDGWADASETYGCVALPEGGLGPLPRITHTVSDTATIPSKATEDSLTWPTRGGDPELYNERTVILDAKCVSPVLDYADLDTEHDNSIPPADLFTVRQWWMRHTSSPYRPEPLWRFSNHRVYRGFPASIGYASHWLSPASMTDPTPDPINWHYTRWTYGGGSLCETRTNAPDIATSSPLGDPYQIGTPVVVAGLGGMRLMATEEEEGLDTAYYVSYPDASDANDDPLYTNPHDQPMKLPTPLGVAMPGIVFGHQGRLMALAGTSGYAFAQRLNYHASDVSFRPASETIMYWPVLDIYNASGARWTTMMEEASTGYGVWCSVSANNLFLVKNQGGGVQISGDVENPTVTRLPGIPSVGFLPNRGVMTERGFVYGSASGIWLWTGSDSAEQLADALDPLFWLPEDPTVTLREPAAIRGSFAYRYPYVFAPNNWMLDMRSGGWWRYHPTPDQDAENGRIYGFNEIECTGNLWAFPLSYTVDAPTLASYFDQHYAVDHWKWKSQPLVRTRNRQLTYRQIVLVGSGTGDIIVSVQGAFDDEPVERRFTLDGDQAQISVGNIAVTTTDLTVTIESIASDADNLAPTLHRLSLLYREAQSVATGARG